jgi:hypothetical protein
MQVHLGGVEYKMDTVPLQDIPFPVRLRRSKPDAAKENEIRYETPEFFFAYLRTHMFLYL